MKQLLENWKKILEGDVVQFPGNDVPPQEVSLDYVMRLEDELAQRLAKTYGNQSEIPIEKLQMLERIVDDVEQLLKVRGEGEEEIL